MKNKVIYEQVEKKMNTLLVKPVYLVLPFEINQLHFGYIWGSLK